MDILEKCFKRIKKNDPAKTYKRNRVEHRDKILKITLPESCEYYVLCIM